MTVVIILVIIADKEDFMLEEILKNVEQCLGKELADTQKLLAEYLIKHGYDSKHVANELRNMEYSYN